MDPLEEFVNEVHSIVATRLGSSFYATSGSTTGSFYAFGPDAYKTVGRKTPPYVEWLPGDGIFDSGRLRDPFDEKVPSVFKQDITARIVGDTYQNARTFHYWIVYGAQNVSGSGSFADPDETTYEKYPRIEYGTMRDVTARNPTSTKFAQVYEQPFRIEINYVPEAVVKQQTHVTASFAAVSGSMTFPCTGSS